MKFLLGHDEEVAHWVGQRVGITDFGPFRAVGVIDDDGSLVAGAVYNNYRQGHSIEATFASATPRSCTRKVLRGLCHIVFEQFGCRRLTALTESKNQPARAFLCRLGFHEEGLLRQGFPTDDAVVFGMLREECPWLRDRGMPMECAA